MHMLEDHVVPFLKQWKIGLGFLGEQGAESIHARWNIIKKNYTSTRPPSQRLQCEMTEHLRQICPINVAEFPQPKTRSKAK